MKPSITNVALSLTYGAWQDEPDIKLDPRWSWSGFEDADSHRMLYVIKHLKVGWEL